MFGLISCGNGSSSFAPKAAYTEHDLTANPNLRLEPGLTIAMFMEPLDVSEVSHNDSGTLGVDIIPLNIEQEGIYTYSLYDDNISGTVARVEMVRLSDSYMVFELNAGTQNATVTLPEGNYDLILYSGYSVNEANGADHRVVFVHSDINSALTNSAVASTDPPDNQVLSVSCSGCNLGQANLVGANLSGVNLAGADLSGADLTGSDITQTNLVDADTTGTLWTTGMPGRTVTLVSNCTIDIWAAASGNTAPKPCKTNDDCGGGECDTTSADPNAHFCKNIFCGTNADCPNNSYCGLPSYDASTSCTKDTDCGPNRFCGKQNNLCGWYTCTFVPLPVTAVQKKVCTSNADCCSGENCGLFCFTTVSHTGKCASLPDSNKGNSWEMKAPSTQTIPVPSPWGGRFWARTGCATQYSPCPEAFCQTDSDCPDHRPCDNQDGAQTSQYFCRSDSDCNAERKELCDTNTTGFLNPPPSEDECQTDDDCYTKYDKANMVCVYDPPTPPGQQPPPGQIKRCGFHQCYTYLCKDTDTCNPQFVCDTGGCLGADNVTFSSNCRGTGKNSPTLAELYMPLFYKYDSQGNIIVINKTKIRDTDFYDVSMVDGANLPVQIAPDVNSYSMDPAGKSCTSDSDCWDKTNRGDHELACLITQGKSGNCVDKYQCGSPGCSSSSDCNNYGQGNGLVKPSSWGGRNMAILEKNCAEELKLKNSSGAYVGCLAPKDACELPSPDPVLNCDIQIPGQGTYVQLYECSGPISGVSCYSDSAPNTCCGCPTWTVDQLFCAGDNTSWHNDAEQPYYQIFHDASPTSYSFPFDDFNSTFTCTGKKEDVLVNYTVSFCPKK